MSVAAVERLLHRSVHDGLPPDPIPKSIAIDICIAASNLFSTESTLLDITGEFLVVGDLHGHVFELLRILRDFGMPPSRRYIFLGDLVDRGDFSVATALFVMVLKCMWPTSVYVVRGNHEFAEINGCLGLLAEVMEEYGDKEVYDEMNRAFSQMAMGARVNGTVLCVHGGLGPGLGSVKQIEEVKRPICESGDPIVEALTWSDPRSDATMRVSQGRGRGFEFGEVALANFLNRNELRLLVRGHQAITDGVKYELGGKVATVFSISNYLGRTQGVCGLLELSADGKTEKVHRLPTLPHVPRKQADLPDIVPPKNRILSCVAPSTGDGTLKRPIVSGAVLRKCSKKLTSQSGALSTKQRVRMAEIPAH
jgi:protein phosphatase